MRHVPRDKTVLGASPPASRGSAGFRPGPVGRTVVGMMLTTTPTSANEERWDATAAVWVAATGAFLLVVAAAVFVAVRWDELPEPAKLGVVGTLTGGFLAGGRALQRRLPGTGDVLFHLGAFLLPVDLAGIGLHVGLSWRELLLAEGVLGTVVFGALAATTGSKVLRWAAATAMLPLSAGVAALTPVAAPLVLATAAMSTAIAFPRARRAATAWAAAAGIAPLTALWVGPLGMVAGRGIGRGVVIDLGLGGRAAALSAAASGAVAAFVLARDANARKDLFSAALAAVSLVIGVGSSWAATNPDGAANILAAAGAFLAIELAAAGAKRDPFWGRLARPVAFASELGALVVAGFGSALLLLLAPFAETGLDIFGDDPGWTPEPSIGIALGLVAVGWFVASWRRQPASPSFTATVTGALRNDWTTLPIATSAAAAVAIGTASSYAIAGALLTIAVGYGLLRGVTTTLVTALAAAWAPIVMTLAHPGATPLIAAGGAAAIVVAATVPARSATAVRALAVAFLAPVTIGAFAANELTYVADVAVVLATAAVLWSGGGAFDTRDGAAGHVVRAALAITAASSFALAPQDAIIVLGFVTAAFVADAIRLDEPLLSFAAVLGAQALIVNAGEAAGVSVPYVGVALCVLAVVTAGVALLCDRAWQVALLAGAAASAAFGFALATGDDHATADALLVLGTATIAGGVAVRNSIVGHVGAAAVVLGAGMHFNAAGVVASEAYLALPCAQLIVIGWQLRRPNVHEEGPLSSWVAYTPAVALLGGAALAERVAGGPAWHALVVGAVGTVAVAVGGWCRLAGPLLVGTALVVGVAVIESLHRLAGVPTWGWLALGGSTLLATGIALERTSTSPVEAGRRLVDVISDQFD